MPPLQLLLAELCYAIPLPSHHRSATEDGWVQKWAAGPAVLSALLWGCCPDLRILQCFRGLLPYLGRKCNRQQG